VHVNVVDCPGLRKGAQPENPISIRCFAKHVRK
jgi:hypothetical protein